MSDDLEVSIYPLDFTSYDKGDYITSEVLSRVTGLDPSTQAYGLKLLEIKTKIESAMQIKGGATVKQEGNGLRVLTDAEATEYNEQQFHNRLSSLGTIHRRQLQVDRSQLSADEQNQHDRRITHGAAYLSALQKVRKQVKLTDVAKPSRRISPAPDQPLAVAQ